MSSRTSSDEHSDGEDSQIDEPDGAETRHSQRSTSTAKSRTPRSGRSRSRQRSQSIGKTNDNYLSAEYRDLLNVDIENINKIFENAKPGLPASQIGASYWTANEKESFFNNLAIHGPGDIRALADAIKTKSESEVAVYLTLLEQGVENEGSPLRRKKSFSHADIPAACELSGKCDEQLGFAASALADLVEQHETQAEKIRFGDQWLIDSKIAADIDDNFDDDEAEVSGTEEGNGENTASRLTEEPNAAEILLQPAKFLQLSRNLFMNHSQDPDLNWQNLIENRVSSSTSSEPALFRSAFNDFYDLTISLTRRVLYASLFQANTRLRANDRRDWSPVAAVRDLDVRAAVDIVGMNADRERYWATLPRRCGVTVTTESKKFSDGRPSTYTGFHLTYDEVEAELGLVRHASPPQYALDPRDEIKDIDLEEIIADSDFCTEDERSVAVETTDSEVEDIKHTGRHFSGGHKRALSPSSFARAENSYLEALDVQRSTACENELIRSLHLDLSPTSSRKLGHDLPAQPQQKYDSGPAQNWRHKTEYGAAWEHALGMPDTEDFEEMEREGKKGRKRRKLLMEKVSEELEHSRSQHGDRNGGYGGAVSEPSESDETGGESTDRSRNQHSAAGRSHHGVASEPSDSEEADVEMSDRSESDDDSKASGSAEDEKSEDKRMRRIG